MTPPLTLPRALRAALLDQDGKTLRELSQELGVSEKLLPDGLEKLELSTRREGGRLKQVPARCLACGFEFRKRERYKPPSRCPECRSERIAPPKFWLELPADA